MTSVECRMCGRTFDTAEACIAGGGLNCPFCGRALEVYPQPGACPSCAPLRAELAAVRDRLAEVERERDEARAEARDRTRERNAAMRALFYEEDSTP